MAVWKEGDGPSRTIHREEFKLNDVRGGEYKSKITKSIQDKETFTRTECTSTVIYKYSSPSSFQLSENNSKYKEQLKDPLTQPFWRAETIT